MFRLLATHGADLFTFALPETEARLGRAASNDLVLPVRGVSRIHALVRRVPGGVEVEDRESKNGLYVAGERMARALLTPGMRLQVGEAWLELEELSSAEAALFKTIEERRRIRASGEPTTLPESLPSKAVSPEAAIAFVVYLEEIGAGVPGERAELLARAREHLGAESLYTVERSRQLYLIRERSPLQGEEEMPAEIVYAPVVLREVRLRRIGARLLAGQGRWFLVARFAAESHAGNAWRRDLLRYLAVRLFAPPRRRREVNDEEVRRVYILSGASVSETARLLGVQRATIHRALERLGLRRPADQK